MTFEVFDDHQRRAIQLLDGVIAAIEPGMTARDVRALADERRDRHGFDRWFQAPDVEIDPRVGRSLRRAPKIAPGTLVSIDLAPASAHAFGDIAVTFAFRAPEPELVSKAREVVRATAGYASPQKVVGELFVYARAWAMNRQCNLVGDSGGHACLPGEGPMAWGWPTSARVAMRLRRHQMRMLNPIRTRGVWALRLPISDGERVAVFEELIALDDQRRVVLGRDGVEAIGAWPSLGVAPAPAIGLKGQKGERAPKGDDGGHDHDHGHEH